MNNWREGLRAEIRNGGSFVNLYVQLRSVGDSQNLVDR